MTGSVGTATRRRTTRLRAPTTVSRAPDGPRHLVGHQDPGAGRLIDINSATEGELRTLPGIGSATARRMIEGRPYGTIDDLLRVKGIGRSKLSQIRSFVALG